MSTYIHKHSISYDDETSEELKFVLKARGEQTVSGLFRKLVAEEALRLRCGENKSSGISSDKVLQELGKIEAVLSAIDDKSFVTLDSLSGLLTAFQIDQSSAKYAPLEIDKKGGTAKASSYVKSSVEHLNRVKHNAGLNKR